MSDVLWIFSRFNWLSAIDILLVALFFYWLLFLIQGTQAVQLLRGIIIIVLLSVLVTSTLQLTAFSWLIRNSIPALLVAIPVIFQPELRRALERLGRTGFPINRPPRRAIIEQTISQICEACQRLSERRHGALLVLERETGLQEYIDTGVKVDAVVTSELLLTIFFPNTALHDGAVIVREDRVVAAACVLPLTESSMADRHLGLRHRAAIGITEQSDAIAIAVSEEAGIISIARNGRIIRHLDEKRLRKVLQAFYRPWPDQALPRWLRSQGKTSGSRLHNFYKALLKPRSKRQR
ncbi:MAG TPA: TIGR00159 family protein [Anaerolineae bacterium]|nr:TIGR00159 family protein [Anaerolineae bacterium]